MIVVLALMLAVGQQSPDAVELQRAQALLDGGRCGDAIPLLEKLLAAHPKAAMLRYGLGRCYFDTENFAAAAGAFREVAREAPKSAEVRFYLGSALGLSGAYGSAVGELRSAIALDPAFEPAYRAFGMFQVQRGEYSKEALEALEKATTLKPGDARAHYWLGRFHQGLGNNGEARRLFERAEQLDSADAQTQLALGQALLADGEFEAALNRFNAVLRGEPALVPALLGKAKALYSLGQTDDALPPAEAGAKAARGFEDERSAAWMLARLYRLLGRDAEAEASEARLAALETSFAAEVTRIREFGDQAAASMASHQPAQAAALLEELLKLRQTPTTLLRLGDAYLEAGRVADAERCYRRAEAEGAISSEIAERLDRLERRKQTR
ncbi:MAG: tetratricopeptide repeat protein [Terracidiphilus sp.]|nr:tetratricopeptide repeat protein [Terracidiphilus sp.]